MLSDSDITRYRKRVNNYVKTTDIREFKDDQITAIVKMPLELSKSKYLEVSNLPSLAELPEMPERMRDFALRSGIEGKTNDQWSEIFNVSRTAIQRWKRDPRVEQIRALTIMERRSYLLAQTIRLERKMYSKLASLLDVEITAETMGAVLSTLKFVHSILTKSPDPEHGTQSHEFNVSIGIGRDGGGEQKSPFSIEREVTPMDIEKVEDQISRADSILKQVRALKEPESDGN